VISSLTGAFAFRRGGVTPDNPAGPARLPQQAPRTQRRNFVGARLAKFGPTIEGAYDHPSACEVVGP
jgi:hypothetical protein